MNDEMKTTMVCPECLGADVWCQAQVEWVTSINRWAIREVYDGQGYCEDCKATVALQRSLRHN